MENSKREEWKENEKDREREREREGETERKEKEKERGRESKRKRRKERGRKEDKRTRSFIFNETYARPASSNWTFFHLLRGPCSGRYCTVTPSGLRRPLARRSSKSSRSNLVKPHLRETKIF